jgi:hypothetical protein
MSAPDDPANLNNNLYTLSRLAGSPDGSKLSFDRGTGRFSIQRPDGLQSVARSLSHDTVTSDESFGRPIRAVFAAAYPDRYRVGAMFNAALDGLKSLRRSYTGDKLAALNAVISDAEHGINKDGRAGIGARLREKYRRFAIFGFSQFTFLPTSNPGVCYSFSIDWARRILGNKGTFGVSKKHAVMVRSTTPNADQKVRMMKKVDSRIRPLQAGFGQQKYENMRPRDVLPMLVRENRSFAKYGTLGVFESVRRRAVARTARGSGVIADVRAAAENDLRATRVFVVNFKYKDTPGGHAIGIHIREDDALHFFDPNIGEFEFPNGADEERDGFLDKWWELLYLELRPSGDDQGEHLAPGQVFESWTLEGVESRVHAV